MAEEGSRRNLHQKFSIFFIDKTRFRNSLTIFESRLVKVSTQKQEKAPVLKNDSEEDCSHSSLFVCLFLVKNTQAKSKVTRGL